VTLLERAQAVAVGLSPTQPPATMATTEARLLALEQQVGALLPVLFTVIEMNKTLCGMLMTREQDEEACH